VTLTLIHHRDSEAHERLCVAMADGGYLLIGDALFEIIDMVPVGRASWAWTVRRQHPPRV